MDESSARQAVRLAARGVPGPLVGLVAAVAAFAFAWAILVPPWQGPDEREHFAYAQTFAERGALPATFEAGQAANAWPGRSTEQSTAALFANAEIPPQNPLGRPAWSPILEDAWLAESKGRSPGSRRNGGGWVHTSENPPGYYAVAVGVYWVAGGGSVFDRLLAVRMLSILFLLGTVVATWALAGEVFGRVRWMQLLSAGVVGLLPMMTFLGAVTSPDSALIFLFTVALYLGARLLRRGLTFWTAALLGLTCGLAALVKAPGYALLPGAAIALAVAAWRTGCVPGGGKRVRSAIAVAVAVALAALPVALYAGLSASAQRPSVNRAGPPVAEIDKSPRAIGSYLWNFYAPRFLSTPDAVTFNRDRGYTAIVRGGFGTFGWLDTYYPEPVYRMAEALLILILAATAGGLIRSVVVRRRRIDLAVLAMMLVTCISLLVAVHWVDYKVVAEGIPFFQGRYLLPLVSIFAICVAFVARLAPTRGRPYAVAVVMGLLVSANIGGLAVTLGRFYE